jgi:hypothetical protein
MDFIWNCRIEKMIESKNAYSQTCDQSPDQEDYNVPLTEYSTSLGIYGRGSLLISVCAKSSFLLSCPSTPQEVLDLFVRKPWHVFRTVSV